MAGSVAFSYQMLVSVYLFGSVFFIQGFTRSPLLHSTRVLGNTEWWKSMDEAFDLTNMVCKSISLSVICRPSPSMCCG